MADALRNVQSIKTGKSDIHQDLVWFQFLGLVNGFQSILYFGDDTKLRPSLKHDADFPSPRFKIIYDKDADNVAIAH